MLLLSTQNRIKRALANSAAGQDLIGQIDGGNFGTAWFVDPFFGKSTNDGRTWATAFSTMAAALTACATGDTIYFRGNVREECVGSNLKFDITIVGCGSLHHPDQPSSAYDPAGAMWRAPASPTAATPLLEVRGRGWNFINIAFDCPVDKAAVLLQANALSDVSEYDASHASFIGCDFQQGLGAVEDNGGCTHVTFQGCTFRAMTPAGAKAIYGSSTAVRLPQNWLIENCNFPGPSASGGNECHIDAALSGSIIRGCTFGTVEGTALYIDLTGGGGNIVTGNLLGGAYEASDYVAGTADLWYGNRCVVTVTTAPDGVTLAVPA